MFLTPGRFTFVALARTPLLLGKRSTFGVRAVVDPVQPKASKGSDLIENPEIGYWRLLLFFNVVPLDRSKGIIGL